MILKSISAVLQAASGKNGIAGMKSILEHAEQEVMQMGELVPAGEEAVARLETAPPGGGVNLMMQGMPLRQKASVLPIMLGMANTIITCGNYMLDELTPTRSHADTAVWRQIETLAKEYGAVEVGFTQISEQDIFKGFAIPYRNAVVFTIDMDKAAIDTAPSYESLLEILRTYHSLGQVALRLTDYLRDLGFGAYPGFPVGGLVDYVRVAADAGIGAIGYHGLLISPTVGARQRINVVFTNMEVPETAVNPHEWVLDFCAKCHKCVRSCPPQAIFTTAPVNPVTGRKQTIHYDKCVDYYGRHQGCGICLDVCPFSQAGYDKIKRGFMKAQTKKEKVAV